MTPMQAIKAKCIECCCGDKKEARMCAITRCPIWQFLEERRKQKETKAKRILTAEEKAALSERLRKNK